MQLKSVSDYISHATGVPNESYSVTLPALATGTPELDNARFPSGCKIAGFAFNEICDFAVPIGGTWLVVAEK